MQFLKPGERSGKHRHMWEEVLFVLEGSGYDLHWDLKFDCLDAFEWEWSAEPRKHEWTRGDFIYVPPFTIHQHFNAHATERGAADRDLQPHGQGDGLRLVRPDRERAGVLRNDARPVESERESGRRNRRPAARLPGAPGAARGARAAHPHRPADQQGHRAASAGALAVPGRAAGERAPRLPVHQRGRLVRPPLRHAGRGRRAGGLGRDLRGRHGPAGRGDRRRLDRGAGASDRAGAGVVAAVPGGGDHRRCVARPRQGPRRPAGAGVDARLRRRALSHGDARRHPRSRDRASATWAPTGRSSRRATGSACAWPRASAAPAATSTGSSIVG